jgi:hypothetical protein
MTRVQQFISASSDDETKRGAGTQILLHTTLCIINLPASSKLCPFLINTKPNPHFLLDKSRQPSASSSCLSSWKAVSSGVRPLLVPALEEEGGAGDRVDRRTDEVTVVIIVRCCYFACCY